MLAKKTVHCSFPSLTLVVIRPFGTAHDELPTASRSGELEASVSRMTSLASVDCWLISGRVSSTCSHCTGCADPAV